jgi:hypothetical protein
MPTVLLALAAWTVPAAAQTVDVPNPSFEKGDDAPAGWSLSGGKGEWLEAGAAAGDRAVAVTGDGKGSNHWLSAPVPLEPGAVYRLTFRARRSDTGGGTPVSGPLFANRDLGAIPGRWETYTSIFAVPAGLADGRSRLRFGQWQVAGTVAFDDVRLCRAMPVYAREGGMELGEGEMLRGTEYTFAAPFGGVSRNHARPLARHTAGYNSNRWTFRTGDEVVYRHAVAGRRQTDAEVSVELTWHSAGELAAAASADGKDWRPLGTLGGVTGGSWPLPDDLLPAEAVWIRLRARPAGGKKDGRASLQVSGYGYRATLDGPPATLIGRTHFVAVTRTDPGLKVRVASLGDGLPGGENTAVLRVTNTTGKTLAVRPAAAVDEAPPAEAKTRKLAPGSHTLRLAYGVPGTGSHTLRLAVGVEEGAGFAAEVPLEVAGLHAADYGERLPGSTDAVGLWWCSSGWKVSRMRGVPTEKGEALSIAAARNEADAAQLVLRPREDLKGLTVEAADLAGPDGATLPASAMEVLKVRYVLVTRPTDSAGCVGWWPDPLPPIKGPLDLEAGRNLPLWVRVSVPKGAAAGTYRGTVRLKAPGWSAEVPVRLRVFDFTLPDRMTCQTAFGLRTGHIWRYQKLEDEADRRAVLAKYLANFADHHISPYDPAPMDPVRVTWPKASPWQGGTVDRTEKHAGEASLKIADNSKTSQVSASYGRLIRIPDGGLRLRFRYKAARGHPFIVSLNHYDAGRDWMSGRNNNFRLEGTGEWETFDRTVTEFPGAARFVRLNLWGCLYEEDGSPTGTVWYDALSLAHAGGGDNLVTGGDFEPRDPATLVPEFDWTAWDAAMTRAMDEHHFNSFRLRVPGMGGGTFHARYEPNLLGYGEDTPEYKAAFSNYCRLLQAHLREKGWLQYAYVYWFDEPDPKDYAFVMNGFRKLKRYLPKVDRMLTEQVEPDLVGGPNLWCPVSHNYDHEAAEKRRAAGDRFWWYVCTGPKTPYAGLFIDHPATELRVWLWQTWKRKIEGVLVWTTNYWTSRAAYPDPDRPQNPYEDPMGWVSGYSTKEGVRRPWGNGDGRFVYPPESCAGADPDGPVLDGPVDSLRWEMLRDGLEDYEYLAILRRLLAEKGKRLSADERARYESLLEVPEAISTDMTHFTSDPAPIEARRREVAEAIETLRGK